MTDDIVNALKVLQLEQEKLLKQAYFEGLVHGAEFEREACAKICDQYALEDENWAGGCAFAIRARGKE